VTTNASGDATFGATIAAPPAGQSYFAATATNLATGDTSEFSRDVFRTTRSIISGTKFYDANGDGVIYRILEEVLARVTPAAPGTGSNFRSSFPVATSHWAMLPSTA